MRYAALAFFLVAITSIAAEELVAGKRYDFYQNNGQNLLGAELLEESEKEYTVRLTYLPKPLRLAKKSLLYPPRLTQGEETVARFRWGREVRLNAQFGYSAVTGGALHDIFPSGYHAAVGADWHAFLPPRFAIRALSLLGAFSSYESGPRFVRQLCLLAGPQFLIFNWKQPQILFTGSVLSGTAFVTLRGYTFASEYTVFAARGIVRAEKSFGPIALGLQLDVNYLFDQSLDFFSSGFGAGVQYAVSRE